MTQVLWRWEQDRSGGLNGFATYFIDTPNETTIPLPDFKTANSLYNAISTTIAETRYQARAGLLREIGIIRP